MVMQLAGEGNAMVMQSTGYGNVPGEGNVINMFSIYTRRHLWGHTMQT